jgi:hypothetical protein
VRQRRNEGHIDWDWLKAQPTVMEEMDGTIRCIRLPKPAEVLVDGNAGNGVLRSN